MDVLGVVVVRDIFVFGLKVFLEGLKVGVLVIVELLGLIGLRGFLFVGGLNLLFMVRMIWLMIRFGFFIYKLRVWVFVVSLSMVGLVGVDFFV